MRPKLARVIDQTFLKKDAREEEVKKKAQEAKGYGFRGLCVFPEQTKLVKEILKDSGVKVITLIDEPTGASPHKKRMEMVKLAK